MPKARTHKENREKICLLCFGKTKCMYSVKGKLKNLVEEYLEYDDLDERLPSVVCSTCKRDLYKLKNSSEHCVKLSNLSDLKAILSSTRSSDNDTCYCVVCELARKPACGNFAIGNHLPKRRSTLRKLSNDQAQSKLNYI